MLGECAGVGVSRLGAQSCLINKGDLPFNIDNMSSVLALDTPNRLRQAKPLIEWKTCSPQPPYLDGLVTFQPLFLCYCLHTLARS